MGKRVNWIDLLTVLGLIGMGLLCLIAILEYLELTKKPLF